jgi:hypothetical protein
MSARILVGSLFLSCSKEGLVVQEADISGGLLDLQGHSSQNSASHHKPQWVCDWMLVKHSCLTRLHYGMHLLHVPQPTTPACHSL